MTEQPHILVVDDDREIRDLVARYLSKHGLRVRARRSTIGPST